MTFRRALAATALVAVAATALTGCESKVGAAAVVGGQRISESDISPYLTGQAIDPALQQQAQAQGAGDIAPPRSQVLQELIKQRIYQQALQHSGGIPSASQLAKLHDEGAQRLYNLSGSGSQIDTQLRSVVGRYGLNHAFATLLIHNAELGDAVVNRVHATSFKQFVHRLRPELRTVSVSPRYGRWRPSSLTLAPSASSGAPGFVKKLGSSAATR